MLRPLLRPPQILAQKFLHIRFPNPPPFSSKNRVAWGNSSGFFRRERRIYDELRRCAVFLRFARHRLYRFCRAVVLGHHSEQRNSNLSCRVLQRRLHRRTVVPSQRRTRLIHHGAERGGPARPEHAHNSSERPTHHSHPLRVGVRQSLDELYSRQHVVGFLLHARDEPRPAIFSDGFAERRAIRLAVPAAFRHDHHIAALGQHLPHVGKRALFSFVPLPRSVVVNHHWKGSSALGFEHVRFDLLLSAGVERRFVGWLLRVRLRRRRVTRY